MKKLFTPLLVLLLVAAIAFPFMADGIGKSLHPEGNPIVHRYGGIAPDLMVQDRIIEPFACSFTADSGGSLNCEEVDFGDMTLSIVQMTEDEILELHFLNPPTYGAGGTLTYDVKFGWRTTTTETSDTATFAIKIGDTIANCEADSWNTVQDTWIQVDEIHWTNEITVTVNGSPAAGEQDLYLQVKCDAYTTSVAPYLDKAWLKFEGK